MLIGRLIKMLFPGVAAIKVRRGLKYHGIGWVDVVEEPDLPLTELAINLPDDFYCISKPTDTNLSFALDTKKRANGNPILKVITISKKHGVYSCNLTIRNQAIGLEDYGLRTLFLPTLRELSRLLTRIKLNSYLCRLTTRRFYQNFCNSL